MSDYEKELVLKQLKGWSRALADAIDKYTSQLIAGEASGDPKDTEFPRNKIRRLVREIGQIGESVEREVFSATPASHS